jgi:hypothetical protein
MTPLHVSVALNLALAAALVLLFIRARQRLIEEKGVTFAGMLDILTRIAATEAFDDRLDQATEILARRTRPDAAEGIRVVLLRAAMIRQLRPRRPC